MEQTANALPPVTLGQYKGLPVTRRVRPVTEAAVASELKSLARRHAPFCATSAPAARGMRVTLDFEGFLDGAPIPEAEIKRRLNEKLVEGVRVLDVYTGGQKIKYLALLDCVLTLEYDDGVPTDAAEKITALLSREEVTVTKKSKNGNTEQNIIPMIRKAAVRETNQNTLTVQARICCQNPSLNPMQIAFAIEKYLPECTPSFVECSRMEIYDQKEQQFR